MRSVTAFGAYPPALGPDGSGGKSSQRNLVRHNADAKAKKSFPSHWNNVDVRGFLYASQWRVCAYCSRPLPGNDRGDVEHFRPKNEPVEASNHGGYWWLAYEVSNYVLSCGVCNSTRKRNKFPIFSERTRATFEVDPTVRNEDIKLLHPKLDNIDELFVVDLSSPLVGIHPSPDLAGRLRDRAAFHIKFFRVNVDQFLIRERIDVLDEVTFALESGDVARARNLSVRFRPHSLVARELLKKVAPEQLPDSVFELDWLLMQIAAEFDRLTSILESHPEDNRSRLELDESIWALSTLRRAYGQNPESSVVDLCVRLGLDEITSERSLALLDA